MPILSDISRGKKAGFFLKDVPKDARILEIGPGSGWFQRYARENGWMDYVGVDIKSPADIVGDIRDWRKLGLASESFDVILAFEVIEHVDCFKECLDLLKPGGRMMITTPVPHMDWALKILEYLGLNQRRSSRHDHLVYLKDVHGFSHKELIIVGKVAQWAIFTK